MMFTPYAPDEYHSFDAKLMALADCLVVKLEQSIDILERTNTYRAYISTDGGRSWNLTDDKELADRIGERTPELISEVS
jgi:hypothetical protein